MLTGFTIISSARHENILQSTHELRYQSFVERMEYSVPIWSSMEYDKYDNLTTIYLSWRDHNNIVRGTCRLAPTDRSYMINDLWPEIVTKVPLPHSTNIWEASRLCVDHQIDPALRKQIIGELVCGYQQIGIAKKIKYMIAVMPPNIWKRVFINSGWDIEFVGPETTLDTGEVIVAGKMNISQEILKNILLITGLEKPPLNLSSDFPDLADEKLSYPSITAELKEVAYA